MRASVTYLLKIGVLMLAVGGCLVVGEPAKATGWGGQSVTTVVEKSVNTLPSSIDYCQGYAGYIPVTDSDAMYHACLFGNSATTRVARYYDQMGTHRYAIAFKGEREYIPIANICSNLLRCAYSHSEDTFLIQVHISSYKTGHMVVKDFSKHLAMSTEHGRKEYFFDYEAAETVHINGGEGGFASNAIGISSNGRWALIELERYGFVRLDMRTLTFKRVIAPGATYGLGNDPWYELAISNDGNYGAITGYGTGLEVYEFSEVCGDTLMPYMLTQFTGPSLPCPAAQLDRTALFPNFWYGQRPKFSPDGSKLMLYIQLYEGQKYAVLSPHGAAVVSNNYLAFGDSFTSGEGEDSDEWYLSETNTTTNKCHVSTRSYPFLAAATWGMPVVSKACSGSRLPDVKAAATAILKTQHPTRISIGVGGNDVDLIGKLKTCLGVGTCQWAQGDYRRGTAEEIRELFYRLTETIEGIKREAPASQIALVSYPLIVNDAPVAPCHPVIGAMLTSEERKFIDETLKYLNKVIRSAAHHSRVAFINAEQAFAGERLCEGGSKAMNGVRTGDDIAPIPLLSSMALIGAESFHPTPYGHVKVAETLTRHYSLNNEASSCVECEGGWVDVEIPQYWGPRTVVAQYHQEARILLENPLLKVGSSIALTLPEGVFKEGSDVVVEVHSERHELGVFQVAADGSVRVEATLPESLEGHHTLFVIGQSVSGEEVRYYQTLYIGIDKTQDGSPDTGVPPQGTGKNESDTSRGGGDGYLPARSQIAALSSGPTSVLGAMTLPSRDVPPSETSLLPRPGVASSSVVQSQFMSPSLLLLIGGALLVGVGGWLVFARFRKRE